MQANRQITDLDPAVLTAELVALRRYGVRRGLGKVSTAVLEAAAWYLSDDLAEPVADQIMSALKMAAKHMGKDNELAVATIMDFGPTKKRNLDQRRKEVARQLQREQKTLENTIERELLESLANHLVRLATERPPPANGQTTRQSQPPAMPKPQRPTVPTHKNKQVDGAVPKAIVNVMTEEVREVCNEGLTGAVTKKRLPLLTRLAETAIPGDETTLQKTDGLLMQVINEVEKSTVVQMGLVVLLELGGLRHQSLRERRQLSRLNLYFTEDQQHDLRSKPHRPKEKEERILKALAKRLGALAILHGIIK